MMLTFEHSNNLSSLDLTIINYIENNYEKVIYMRVRDLANETYTSPATVLRCIKKLGFANFPEFKAQLQLKKNYKKEHTETAFPFSFQKSFEKDLTTIGNLIEKADITYCLGLGNSQLMATYASNLLTTIGFRSFSTDPVLSSYSLNNKQHPTLSVQDVCLIFSASGESHSIVQLAEDLQETSIVTISISSQEFNSLATYTDYHFNYNSAIERTPHNLDLSSQLPTVYFIEALIQFLMKKKSSQ